jgi:High potential iron-sulfur protein
MAADRREFLGLAAAAPMLIFGTQQAIADSPACYDPAKLALSQKSRRRSLGYVEMSPDAKKRCGLCAFFAAGSGNCGTCQLLAGGPVNMGAVCNSFAAKA